MDWRADLNMALSNKVRFRILAQVDEHLTEYRDDWPLDRQDLLLTTYGLGRLDREDAYAPGLSVRAATLPDVSLLEFAESVLGEPMDDVKRAASSADGPADANWRNGMVRLFLSHSSIHRAFVGEIAEELAKLGVHGFVAHDSLTVDDYWSPQIEACLQTMDAFVALVHPEFIVSQWCQQELGWALGRGVPKLVLRLGSDIGGPAGARQWPSASGESARQVATRIYEFIAGYSTLETPMADGLITALATANNFTDAGKAADAIALLPTLSEPQWARIAQAFHANSQVGGCALVNRALGPYYRKHSRDWPPPEIGTQR